MIDKTIMDQIEETSQRVRKSGKRIWLYWEELSSKKQLPEKFEDIHKPRKAHVISSAPIEDGYPVLGMQLAIAENTISEKITEAIEIITKKGVPDCLKKPYHESFYTAIVYYEAVKSEIYKNKQLFYDLGCNYAEIQSWGDSINADLFWQRIMNLLRLCRH